MDEKHIKFNREKCLYREYKTKDYMYHLHVMDGFFGCNIKREKCSNVTNNDCPEQKEKKIQNVKSLSL